MVKNIRIWGMLLLGILVYSCAEDASELPAGNDGAPTLSFDMTRSPQSIIDNAQIYMFDNPSWEFNKQVLGVTSDTDKLSMKVEAGTWNLAFVTAETSIASGFKSPIRTQARTGKMWETPSVAGELPSMPELRTAYLTGQQVIANQQNYGNETLMLYRNVALVKVVIEKTRGLDPTGTHKLELKNVPTTLNWAGGLYPDKDNPTTSPDPLKGTFTIKDKLGEPGIQDSDTLEFIIPAHKGTDFLGAHKDTTTSNLTVSIDVACLGNVRYKKADVEIPRVPRVNGILIVRLSMIGQLEVNAEVLDWVDEELNADLSQTQLLVDKAEVGLAYKDTVYVNTNASSFTFAKDPSATWITALNPIGSNGVEIVADINSYVDNKPRSSYITITANNITKKIPVTQRPDRGTISVTPEHLILSPGTTGWNSRSVIVNSIGDWSMINAPQKSTASSQNGDGNNNSLTFTRKTTTDFNEFDTYYGDEYIYLKNKKTLEIVPARISNLYLDIDEEIMVGNDKNLAVNTADIPVVAMGGSEDFIVESQPSWLTVSRVDNTTIRISANYIDIEDAREGYMTLSHKDDPNYKITVKVIQDMFVPIPPFNHFVLRFYWSAGKDLDIAVGFENTYDPSSPALEYYNKAVGFGMNDRGTSNYGMRNNRVYYPETSNTFLLEWGGDNQGTGGECAYFNAPVIDDDSDSPRYLHLHVYAQWYVTKSTTPIEMEVTCYQGGSMKKNGTLFETDGGTLVYPNADSAPGSNRYKGIVYAGTGSSQIANYRSDYTHVSTITYDKRRHTAKVVMHTAPTRSMSATRAFMGAYNNDSTNFINEK